METIIQFVIQLYIERKNKMILTEEQRKELEEVVKPVMKFLCENFHPHVTIIIEPTQAEILEGSASVVTDEFVKD